MDDTKKDVKNEEELKWEPSPYPNIYHRLEGILYQASWVIQQELEKQKEKAELVKKVIEQDIGNQTEWRTGKQ